ncbi:glycosyltransferase family 4 protein [Tichowtungia aerotolerans]|nr:glycosyltransferase family 4 protein [Tichowtungia aerotolerans]
MAKHHDVWVLTRANNRTVIEEELKERPVPGINFVYYDLPEWAMWWKKGGRGVQIYYYLWEVFSESVVRRTERQIGFDVAHHVTIVRYWTPSNLRNIRVPFVWGPVGGGESTPKALKKNFSLKNRIIEQVRDLMRWIGECDPLVRKTARKSSLAIATTNETAARLKALRGERVQVQSQLGTGALTASLEVDDGSDPKIVRFICIGKQIYWKGFDLALKAFANVDINNAKLIFVGEGPEHKSLQDLASDLGLHDSVRFEKWMDQKTLHELLVKCDALIHPSFHDSGAFVCLEAMAASKPVICLDLGGPAVQVTSETGIKVAALNPKQTVQDLASAMRRLAIDPALRKQMGDVGRKRVEEHFLWTAKVDAFCQMYESILESKDCHVR